MIIRQIKCHNTRMVRSRTVVVVKPGKARKRQLEAIEKRKRWSKVETSKEETIKWECEDSDKFLRMYGGGCDECERESSDEEIKKQGEELELKAFIFKGSLEASGYQGQTIPVMVCFAHSAKDSKRG